MSYNTAVKRAPLRDLIDVVVHTKRPRILKRISKTRGLGVCYVCGSRDGFTFKGILNDELSAAWGLNRKLRKAFDIRESTNCVNCRTSLRSNLHARAICEAIAPAATNLREAVKSKEARKLKVAEINACGALHEVLAELPQLAYSEYMPADKKIRHEDITDLSYKDNTFDIVLTSETLEHVPDWERAMQEINRVLKKGGKHIFTVPAILSRQTRFRVVSDNGKVKELLPPSFHGCTRDVSSQDYTVCTEFGADFRRRTDEFGFDTRIYYRDALSLSDPNAVFISTKV